MKFEKMDQKELEKTLLPQIDENTRVVKKRDTILLVSLIVFVVSVVLINVFLPEYGTFLYVVCFSCITVTMLVLFFVGGLRMSCISVVRKDNELKMKIEQPDTFTINKDFSIAIDTEEGAYRLDNIKAFDSYQNAPYLVNIHCILTKNNIKVREKFEMLAVMEKQYILNQFLQLNRDVFHMKFYQNNTLEKILLMDSENRSRLFVEELMDAKVFIAIRYVEDKEESMLYPYSQDILLSFYNEEEKLCLYTNTNKIQEDIKKEYPRGFLVPFEDILTIIQQEDNHIFKEKIKGIILNPNTDHVVLEMSQINVLQSMKKEKAYDNYRN